MRSSMWGLKASSAAKYTPLEEASSSHQETRNSHRKSVQVTYSSISVLTLSLLFISFVSFKAGQHFGSSSKTDASAKEIVQRKQLFDPPRFDVGSLLRRQVGPLSYIFAFDELFAAQPNITTNKAWLDLFPMQGGFFQHPQLAPDRSTFAAFHQLHCLVFQPAVFLYAFGTSLTLLQDGLRQAYWTLYDLTQHSNHDKKAHGDHLPHHASPEHVQHCIDLLRNALICQPDLTVEVQNNKLGGVTGFGTEHQCVNWTRLVEWTTQWETYGQKELEDMEPDITEHGKAK